MNFLNYVKDKRYFLCFYFMIMVFISILFILSSDLEQAWNHVIYINISCFFFVLLYVVIGYFYRIRFYKKMEELIHSPHDEALISLPKGKNYEQQLYLDLFKKIMNTHHKELQSLYKQKREHEEYIMSWVHEIKLPITSSHLLLENYEGKRVDLLMNKLEDELNKIEDYVEQALYYSRVDSFANDYFITELDLNKVIKNSVKKYSKIFIHKEIRFMMDDKQKKFVHSDKKWLGFIMDQIITNALKYTEKNGTISIYFEQDDKEKRLIIQDNGIGIKEEDINRVFERGFTGTTGRNHSKATGMGLYLAKKLANKLGHDLSIASLEGEWTKVTIHFPKIRNYYYLDNVQM